MTSPAEYAPASSNVPYADPEPLDEVMEECRCAQQECEAHRIDADGTPSPGAAGHPEPVGIDESTQHLVDGYSDYGG